MAMDKKSKYASLKEKMVELKRPAGVFAGKDARFYTPVLSDTTKTNTVKIRVLPSETTEFPWVKVSTHFVKGSVGRFINRCREDLGGKCPVCDYKWSKWTKGGKEANDHLKHLHAAVKYYACILIVNDKVTPENNGKVFLYKFTPEHYKAFDEAFSEDKYFMDEDEGYNITLAVKVKGEYIQTDILIGDDATPLARTPAQTKEILASVIDLSEFLVENDTQMYKADDYVSRFNVAMGFDDEVHAPVPNKAKPKSNVTTSKTNRPVVETVEDDDDFSAFDTEDDEFDSDDDDDFID